MLFKDLSIFFEKLEKTPSRLTMTEILADLFKEVSAQEIPIVVNLSLGQLKPQFDRLEFNLAIKMVIRALAQAFEISETDVWKSFKEVGDVGEVTQQLKAKSGEILRQSGSSHLTRSAQDDNLDLKSLSSLSNKTMKDGLNIIEVYEKLVVIAKDSGAGSQERKINGLVDLIHPMDALSAKFVVRMVMGRLRLGFSDMTILDALSWMAKGDKSARKQLEWAYQVRPDVGLLAEMVKESGVEGIENKVEVALGVPIVPALAQRLKTADDMIKKVGTVSVEPKFDGTRVQIHFRRRAKSKEHSPKDTITLSSKPLALSNDNWAVRTFTRNLDETTHMFPELEHIAEHVEADELILDSEAIAYDPETGKLKPFQETIQRKRKHGIDEASKTLPLKFFVFDVMYKNGESLVNLPFEKRREILLNSVKTGELFVVPDVTVTNDPEEIRVEHAKFLAEGLEGAMVKKWDGVYEPGRRGWSWVKFKEVEGTAAKLSDTVDAVVMGLYVGKGKRTVFGVGAFLIGVSSNQEISNPKSQIPNSNPELFEEGNFYTISKVGTGLSDDQWRELKERSLKLTVPEKPKEYQVDKNLEPDIWLDPGLVVEIAADEVTVSPIHTAGMALRFPRLVKFRDDKRADQSTTLSELQQIV